MHLGAKEEENAVDEKMGRTRTRCVLHAQVLEEIEVLRQTVDATLASLLPAPILVYERGCIDHK